MKKSIKNSKIKNLIYGILFLLFTPLLCFSCTKDEVKEHQKKEATEKLNKISLSQDKIITELKNAVAYFKSNNNSRGQKSLENDYKTNLEYINKKTGLNLNYDEEEINAVKNSLKDDFINNSFSFSNKEYLRNIEIIKANGDYELFLEVKIIIDEVCSYNIKNRYENKAFSWRCGVALAGNFVATLGLSACATGVGCPIAIAGKVLALA